MSDERYEIRGKIGQGGVGAVYRAYDRNLNREVAIKRVLTEEGFDANDSEDEATRALLKEATALCSVQHPNIVTVYDAGVDSDGPYVVMELLSGRTLDEMVERGTMTWGDFRETGVQSLEALIAAQDLNLVHRDIKPSNVMVTWLPSGKFQVKLVDFGLAKFSSKPSLQTIDHGDAVFGSIHFMAPEQFERTHLDQRTDMYSLGCVFFFCLTGNYPFDGESAPLVMAAHLQNTFTPLSEYRPDLPDWVCQWVEWHLARSPDDRPSDAREALERFLSFETPVSGADAPVNVRAISAASLGEPVDGEGSTEGQTGRITGPVPLHNSNEAEGGVSTQTGSFSRLLTGVIDTKADPNATQPVALAPPDGSKPSIHTGAQVTQRTTGPVPYSTAPAGGGASLLTGPQALPPGMSPAQPASAAPTAKPAVAIPAKGSQNMAAKVTVGVILAIAIAIASWFLADQKKTADENEALQVLLEPAGDPTVTDIAVTEEQLDVLLSAAGKDEPRVYQALFRASTTEDVDIDESIVKFAIGDSVGEKTRLDLFEVLEKRGSDSVVTPLMKFIGESKEENSVVAAIRVMSKNLRDRDLKEFYKLLTFSESSDIRAAAEKAAQNYISAQKNTQLITRDLISAYDAASSEPKVQYAYLRLLGATSNSRATDTLKEALASEDENLRMAAYTSLSNWRDDELFDEQLSAAAVESTPFVRMHAIGTVMALLDHPLDVSKERKVEMWKLVAKEVQGASEKKEFISTIARSPRTWSMDLVKPYASDSNKEVANLAKRALESIKRRKNTGIKDTGL